MAKNKKTPDEEVINETIEETAEDVSAEETTETAAEETTAAESTTDTADDETEKLKKELEETKEARMRLLAEYDNYRKRTTKEKTDIYSDAQAKTVNEFLSVIDNFDRAMSVESTDEKFKSGMQMIFNQYLEILKKIGVSEIGAEGEEFDPNLHHAVSQVEDEELGENTIAQVFQKGYKLGDRIIRPAMVSVANP